MAQWLSHEFHDSAVLSSNRSNLKCIESFLQMLAENLPLFEKTKITQISGQVRPLSYLITRQLFYHWTHSVSLLVETSILLKFFTQGGLTCRGLFHKTLRIRKLPICSYDQILTLNLLINAKWP